MTDLQAQRNEKDLAYGVPQVAIDWYTSLWDDTTLGKRPSPLVSVPNAAWDFRQKQVADFEARLGLPNLSQMDRWEIQHAIEQWTKHHWAFARVDAEWMHYGVEFTVMHEVNHGLHVDDNGDVQVSDVHPQTVADLKGYEHVKRAPSSHTANEHGVHGIWIAEPLYEVARRIPHLADELNQLGCGFTFG